MDLCYEALLIWTESCGRIEDSNWFDSKKLAEINDTRKNKQKLAQEHKIPAVIAA